MWESILVIKGKDCSLLVSFHSQKKLRPKVDEEANLGLFIF